MVDFSSLDDSFRTEVLDTALSTSEDIPTLIRWPLDAFFSQRTHPTVHD